jgi:adenylate cyclase
MACDSVERERTWLVRSLPDPLPAGTPIVQGYLASDDEAGVRIRRVGDRHVATVKGRGTRSRVEVEWDLTAEQFEALWPLTGCRRVEKVRHEVPLGPLTAEVDVFAGALEGLVLVEVEFEDESEMAAFTAPDWFGIEVSDDPRYGNASLARDGLPEDAADR